MSGTLHELVTGLRSIKQALSGLTEDEAETDHIEDYAAKVESAIGLVNKLKSNPTDSRLLHNLAWTLRDIIDAKKDPLLAERISPQSLDNLEKFFQPPGQPTNFFTDKSRLEHSTVRPRKSMTKQHRG